MNAGMAIAEAYLILLFACKRCEFALKNVKDEATVKKLKICRASSKNRKFATTDCDNKGCLSLNLNFDDFPLHLFA